MLAWVKAWHPAVRWGTALGLGLLALALLWTALASLIFLLGTRQLRVQGYQFAAFWQFLLEWGGHPRVAPWLRLAAIGATVGTPAVLAGAAWLAWPRIKRPLHGTSAHATGPEITAMGLHSTEPVGLYLGKLDGRYLRSSDPSHVAAYAPSRAGKGVGLVVPNLLTWAGSMLVLDVKGTLFRDTAGARAARGERVFRFDPLSPTAQTARFNPLSWIDRRGTTVFTDLQRVAVILFPHQQGGSEKFFSDAARSLFVAVAGFVAETSDMHLSLGVIVRTFMRADFDAWAETTVQARFEAGTPYSEAVAFGLADYMTSNPKTRKDIRKTVTTALALYLDPQIDAVTAESDFDLRDLRRARMAIYVVANEVSMKTLQPLFGLFFQLFVDLNTTVAPKDDPALRHAVLIMLDEFARLGKMPVMAGAFSYVAEFGLKLFAVLQSKGQLVDLYGPDLARDVFMNCDIEVAFATKDLVLSNELSELQGDNTEQSASVSRSRFGLGMAAADQRETLAPQPRRLMLPQEVRRMRADQELVFVVGHPPVLANKLRYYEDHNFTGLQRPPPVVPRLAVEARFHDGTPFTNPDAPGANRDITPQFPAVAPEPELERSFLEDHTKSF